MCEYFVRDRERERDDLKWTNEVAGVCLGHHGDEAARGLRWFTVYSSMGRQVRKQDI